MRQGVGSTHLTAHIPFHLPGYLASKSLLKPPSRLYAKSNERQRHLSAFSYSVRCLDCVLIREWG